MIGILFLSSIVVLSQSSTLIRFANADSLAICFWRLAISVALLAPLLIVKGGRKEVHTKLRSLSKSDLVHLFLSGLFLFAHFYLFFRAVQETSIANATILFSLAPITTAVGAYLLFRERITLHLALACALGLAGVTVLFGGSLTTSSLVPGSAISRGITGNTWAVLSATCFSGYILTGKRVRLKLPNLVYAGCVYLQTALYAGLVMLAAGTPFFGYSSQTWLAFGLLALFPTLLGHAIFTYCLSSLDVNFMSCAKLLEPVLAALAAGILFKEPLTELAVIGFLLTCASVITLYFPALRTWATRRSA